MLDQPINDLFVDYQVFKKEILRDMSDAPGHIIMDVKSTDDVIRTAIYQARRQISSIKHSFEAGLEHVKGGEE